MFHSLGNYQPNMNSRTGAQPDNNQARNKRAGNEPSGQIVKRAALGDISNHKPNNGIVRIDKNTVINGSHIPESGGHGRQTSSQALSSRRTSSTSTGSSSSSNSSGLLSQPPLFPFVGELKSNKNYIDLDELPDDLPQPQPTTNIAASNGMFTIPKPIFPPSMLSKEDLDYYNPNNNNDDKSVLLYSTPKEQTDFMDLEVPQELIQPRPHNVRDIDVTDELDPFACSCYVNDIHLNMRKSEAKYIPSSCYFEKQKDINPSMRSILIDWLVEVAEEYKLAIDTLYLAVNYLDRFLSKNLVMRGNLQLLGVVCMLIAAKFEEVYAPAVEDFVFIADNTYSKEEIFEMEGVVLNSLEFNLTPPTAVAFLKRYLKAADADTTTNALAHYIAELTLLDYSFVKYPPSIIATCSVCIALHTVNSMCWTPTLEYYTGYSITEGSQIASCLREMFTMYVHCHKSPLQAIRDKYSHNKFLRVSEVPPPSGFPPIYHPS